MRTWTAERLAKLGIAVQFLALVRNLAEYFRLKAVYRGAPTLASLDPFIAASLVTAVCTGLAVALFFGGRYKGAVVVCLATVALLAGYKIFLVVRP